MSAGSPASPPPAPRLRDDLDSLTVLVNRAAAHMGVDAAFVEKDFWVTELLRAVAGGDYVSDAEGNQLPVTTVFVQPTYEQCLAVVKSSRQLL